MKKVFIPLLVILAVLSFDQGLKYHVKTSFSHKTGTNLFTEEPWNERSDQPLQLYFIENEGMAFGIKIWGKHGKLFLTLFRLVAVSVIGIYLFLLLRADARMSLLVSISLVFAGAMGNIVDSVFYGIVFSESLDYGPVASFMPDGGGYAPVFYGKVVDMFYFPLLRGTWPEWLPVVGGNRYEFFRPIFNVADAAITIGVFSVLVFHRRHFTRSEPVSEEPRELNSEALVSASGNSDESNEVIVAEPVGPAETEREEEPSDDPEGAGDSDTEGK